MPSFFKSPFGNTNTGFTSPFALPNTGYNQVPGATSLNSPSTTTPSSTSLQGGPTQSGSGAYGSVPTVPDPSSTQLNAILGNLKNLGNLYNLSNNLNTEIANEATIPLKLNLPNYEQNLGLAAGNTTNLLQGQIPSDVKNQLIQNAAERGISTGSMGSPDSNAALMRALGVTSLGLQNQGLSNLNTLIGATPTGKPFDPNTFLTNPADQEMLQYLANLLKSAPTPGAGDRLNLQNLLKGLGGLGGMTSPRSGGGGNPNADWFGNIYNSPGGGGGAPSSGYRGSPSPGGDPWIDSFWNTFDTGNDIFTDMMPSNLTNPDWANMNPGSATGYGAPPVPTDFDYYNYYGGGG